MTKRNKIIALAGLLLIGLFVWFFRPVSWRHYAPAQAVSASIGMGMAQRGRAEWPGWLALPTVIEERNTLLRWLSDDVKINGQQQLHLDLLQDTGPAGLALTVVVDMGKEQRRFADWESQLSPQRFNETHYSGFAITEYLTDSSSVYFLLYGNLLIAGRLALVVEEALAQLRSGRQSVWQAHWQEPAANPVYYVYGRTFASYAALPAAATRPWLTMLIKDYPGWLRLQQVAEEWIIDLLENTGTSMWEMTNVQTLTTDSLSNWIPRSTSAWLRWAGRPTGTPPLPWQRFWQQTSGNKAQLLLPDTRPEDPGRLWLSTSADPAERNRILAEMTKDWPVLQNADYLSFTMTELRAPTPLDRLGHWPQHTSTWYTTLNHLTVLADRRTTLEKWITAYVVSEMQVREPDYTGNLSAFYLRPQELPPLLTVAATTEVTGTLNRVRGKLQLRLSPLTDSTLLLVPPKSNTELAWRYELAAPVGVAPRAVKTLAGTPTGEVVVQDSTGRAYLLDATGREVWQQNWPGRLYSEVWRLDAGKPTYVFSTDTHWGIVDVHGQWLPSFPLPLASKATAGMQLVDFDGSGRYYVFVPLQGGVIQAYSLSAEPLPAWNPCLIGADVEHPVVHFQHGYQDFFLAVDAQGVLHLLDKAAKPRFDSLPPLRGLRGPPYYQADATAQRIAVLDSTGRVQVMNTVGQSFALAMEAAGHNPEFFIFAPVTGDARYDYIATDHKTIWVKAYDAQAFSLAYKIQPTHAIDTLFTLGSKGSQQLIGALDRTRRVFSVWQQDRLRRADMPLAGAYPCVWLGENRYATAFDNAILVYTF